jgi:peptide/nickel transport system ATP-binding protein
MTLLSIRDLAVSYGDQPVLHGVSLDIERGECLGIVGESGCGKSTLALAAIRYLPRGGRVTGGKITITGQNVTARDPADMRDLWTHHIGMVYQDPSRALNPTMTIAAQLDEAYAILGNDRAESRKKSESALARVRIPNPARILPAYPHELSGGMQQRVVIAIALAKNPSLLVLDEPTTGLDATVEAGILDTIDALRRRSGMAVLLISHNLRIIGRMADRTGVLYAGVLIEQGPTAALLRQPLHPYTARLLRCLPEAGRRKQDGPLQTIPGQLPALGHLPQGCVFAPRCHLAQPVCNTRPPARGTEDHRARCHFDPPFAEPVPEGRPAPGAPPYANITLRAVNVAKTYRQRGRDVAALTALSLHLKAGETLGLVGESGSGKTTLARILLGLTAPDPGGAVILDGTPLAPRLRARSRADRRAMQIIFQNPDSALNRAQTVRTILSRPISRFTRLRGAALRERVASLAQAVRLAPAQLAQRPRALSGGLKQRVAIARAFAGAPRITICDEPTSSLDVSVQAAILNLLNDLQRDEQSAYLFISHDLNVVRYMADRVAVLYRGTLVEMGPAAAVFSGPNHPYTKALLSAEPLKLTDAAGQAGGCIFQQSCPRKLGRICETDDPEFSGEQHEIRCHIPWDAL